jgi:hypothetical protein
MSKKAIVALTIGGVLALCCIGGVVILAVSLGGGNSTNGGGGGSKPAAAASLGAAVRDGKFEFVVQKVQCGVGEVGQDSVGKKAQGQFCLVTTSVRNIGKEARTLDASNQKAYDAAGAEYQTDSLAGLYANKNSEAFLTNINPGNQVTAMLVFDVPKGGKLTKVELHDSAFSGGVTVACA